MREVSADDPEAAEFFGHVLEESPDPDPSHEWIWRAWWTLNAGDRPHQVMGFSSIAGMMIRSVPGPLPWSVIQKWIEVHDISVTRADILRHVMADMDKTYLDWWQERAKQDGK